MGIVVQVIATVLLSISCVNLGITFTWPSSTILLFKSENTTLHRPMKDIDITLFTSLPLFGTLVSQPLVVLGILDKLGLKRTTLLTSLLLTIAWSIIAVSNRVEAILLAATITGCGCVIFITVSMYISEIVQDSIRGTLISVPNLSVGLGLVGSYLLGGLLEYYTMVYCYLSLAIFGVLAILFLKESPVYLMMKGREEEAVKSLAFYRQTSSTSKEILTEINNIRRSLNKDLEDTKSLTQVAEREMLSSGTERKSCWQLIKTCSSIRRQLYLAMVLYAAYVFQGLPSVQVYAVPIFTATVGDIVSPNVCSVVLGILILVTGTFAAYLIEKIGRRPLQLYASIVCGFCCLFIGTQMLTQWFPNIMTLVFIYVFTIAHTAGSGTVPFVVIAEIFLPEVKSKLYMLTTEWGYLCAFGWMFIFSTVVQSFGFSPVFFFFSFACFATAVYFFYYLPETKGMPVYAIQTLFTNEIDK